MKDTNAIEKALKARIEKECKVLVDDFVAELEKLSNKYGGTMFYDFKKDEYDSATQFHVQGTTGVTNVLHRMVLANHAKYMLSYKSKELIKKLDLI